MSRICKACNGQGRVLAPGKNEEERARVVEIMQELGVNIPSSGVMLCSWCDGTGVRDDNPA